MKVKKRASPSPAIIRLVLVGTAAVVVTLIVLTRGILKSHTAKVNDPTGLMTCGSMPCPSKGDPHAPVTIIEVADYACPACRAYNQYTAPKVEEQYIKAGKVYYVVHSFNLWPQTESLAATALCAADQGKFWDYHALLFQNQGQFTPNELSSYALQAGMDVQAFAMCVNLGKHTGDVAASSNAARTAGVTSTPSFFINGMLVVGALPFQCTPGARGCEQGGFQTYIETALKNSE